MINASETQALRDLQRIASSLDIPVMLIGAGARLFTLERMWGNCASVKPLNDSCQLSARWLIPISKELGNLSVLLATSMKMKNAVVKWLQPSSRFGMVSNNKR